MKKIIIALVFSNILFTKIIAQELFVFTEPASNMPAKSLGIRMANSFMQQKQTSGINYHNIPEVMFGINNTVMLHAQTFLSNRNKSFVAEGGSIYAKLRFLSIDDIHKHFRLATFAKYSFNNSDIHQQEIDLNGHNSGYMLGCIATQLLHKVAISSSIVYVNATNNGSNKFPTNQQNSAINYTFSVGKLMLPKEYANYNQTNVNFMLEMLGQNLLGSSINYVDIAPSLQFIFKSQARVDVAYRHQLSSNMIRTASNGFVVKFEYLFFNALKSK